MLSTGLTNQRSLKLKNGGRLIGVEKEISSLYYSGRNRTDLYGFFLSMVLPKSGSLNKLAHDHFIKAQLQSARARANWKHRQLALDKIIGIVIL